MIFGDIPIKKFAKTFSNIENAEDSTRELIESDRRNPNFCQKVSLTYTPCNYDQEIYDKDIKVTHEFRSIGIYNVKPADSDLWGSAQAVPWKLPFIVQSLKLEDLLVKGKMEGQLKGKNLGQAEALRKSFLSWEEVMGCEIEFRCKQPFVVDGRYFFGYSFFRVSAVRNEFKQFLKVPVSNFVPFWH